MFFFFLVVIYTMVRIKEKAKGDSAFTKRKQKVGRKKLAPATATRAEVHARTLRLATSTAMTAAMAAPLVADPARHPPSSSAAAGQKAAEEKRTRPTIAVQNFAELLAGTHHYKSAQRASAFATLTRLLTAQKEREEAAAALSPQRARTRGESSSAFDEYMRHAAAECAAADEKTKIMTTTTAAVRGLLGLTALEKLKAFAAALEAITDTDDDVRRNALQSLEVLVDFQWISPGREGSSSTCPLTPTTQDVAELDCCNELLLDLQAGQVRETERFLTSDATAPSFAPSPSLQNTAADGSTVSVDRVKAILQSVHVALTHALKPVRLSGVELLVLLLRVAPPELVRAAALAVCRHQTAFYYSSPVAAMNSGLTMAQPSAASSTASSTAVPALEAAQSRAASLLEEEEKWMLTLVRRVSTLVLRTKHIGVLPTLLGVFLGEGAAGHSVAVELLRGCLDELSAQGGSRAAAAADAGVEAATSQSPVWRHPELVSRFFDEIAPQWANHWKELMDLRLELLRQEEKLAMASALARAFATVLVFLKRQQQQKGDAVKGSKLNFFSRNRTYYIKALFIEKMPVTMRELLMPMQGTSSSSVVSPRGMKARLELGLALVMVCLPLAGTDEGWHLMRDYFSIVLSLPQKSPQPEGDAAAEKKRDASLSGASGGPIAVPPFHFPSLALLEMTVRLYAQVLRLYPCTAAHVHLAGSEAETAVWAEPRSTLNLFGSTHERSSWREGASWSSQQQQRQQHSTVVIRLLSLFPALLSTVVKHIVPRAVSAAAAAAAPSSADSESTALVRTLLCTSQILEQLAALPDNLLRGRGSGASDPSSPISDASAAAKKLEEGFGLVPRLLFSLREQAAVSRPVAAKRPRGDEADDNAGGETAHATENRAAEARVGVLLAYPGVVDALVRRLLRVLWFLSSSGHPLLTGAASNSSSSDGDAANAGSSTVATPFARLLQKSVMFLFGHPQASVRGVLQRCAVPTVLLAHSILYYLGGLEGNVPDRAAETAAETAPLAEAAVKWADIVEVLRSMRA